MERSSRLAAERDLRRKPDREHGQQGRGREQQRAEGDVPGTRGAQEALGADPEDGGRPDQACPQRRETRVRAKVEEADHRTIIVS